MRIRLEDFVAETFSSYLGTSFCFRCPERPEGFLRLKLREVHPASGPAGPLPVRRGGLFSLVFQSAVQTQSVGDLSQILQPHFVPSAVPFTPVSRPRPRPVRAALFE